MRSALLCASIAEELFIISRLSRSAERSKRIFTGGVVKASGICSAAFCENAALRESFLALSGANAPALPRGEPLAWRYSFRLKCKVYGLARASPFGRGGTA